ncbi:hypothetical protein KDA_39090 [Dictyobacter alpinus]|uniref:TfoX N-terminal domain-containing protein n=1 Tax=Dictyobacter alpinus TaxID=2014873 RepID=A0A402BAP5_9CHLR|nr:hypothetical protein [Dictyobacter alpinus]GCE28425.1 hypothetical protein KDA_39090 [Dictyobacter alpinus]
MDDLAITPEERFARLIEEFVGQPDVTLPSHGKGFGSAELKVRQKIFAMLSRDKLVVKLPRTRVNTLIASGDGEPFDPRKNGQFMKEWVCIEPTSPAEWLPLAREAMEFVASKG